MAREHQAVLPEILRKGALRYGFSTALWTIPRIVKVAEAEWGVSYSETAIWRMLKRQGLSGQRPRLQAREKNLTQLRNWRQRSWPRYKKSLTTNSRRSVRQRERLLALPVRREDLGAGRPDPATGSPRPIAEGLGDQWSHPERSPVLPNASALDLRPTGDCAPPPLAPPHPSTADHDLLGQRIPSPIEARPNPPGDPTTTRGPPLSGVLARAEPGRVGVESPETARARRLRPARCARAPTGGPSVGHADGSPAQPDSILRRPQPTLRLTDGR